MNILIFHQFYTRLNEPGILRFNLFAEHWRKEGVKIKVIAGMINYQTGKKREEYKRKLFVKEKDGNVSVLRVFDSSLGYRTFIGRIFSYLSFLFFSFWAGVFSPKPDMIIVSSPPIFLAFVGYIVSIFKVAPFVLELRDLWPDEVIELGYVKNKLIIKISYLIEKFFYRKAKFIIVNSPGFKEFLMKEKNIAEEKIGVVPNPANFDLKQRNATQLKGLKKEFSWEGKFVVLYAGSHSFVYNFNPLIEAAKNLQNKKDILFVLIGDGRQKPVLMERVKKENIKNVQFLAPVAKDKVFDYIAAADVGIAPLSSMKLLKYVYVTKIFDYMAAKKPVILVMEGVSADLVCREAKCGLCISPGDAKALESALLEFHSKCEEIKGIGENGYQFAKNNFSADILAKRYLELLKPIIVPKR